MTASTDAPAGARAQQERMPDFFIVGHPKCGTTALYEMLTRHPQIHMPVKEPRFFAPVQRQRGSGPGSTAHLPETLEEYLSIFDAARPGQRVGDASAQYLMSHTAATEIAELQPAARIVAILREPAGFLRSLHLQSVQDHVETEKDLGKAIGLERLRREGDALPRDPMRPQALLYSEHVRYVEQLRRYQAVFPSEQVLILIYDDFRADNERVVRRVLRFLDVDELSSFEATQANPTVRLRSRKMDELLNSLSLGRGPFSRVLKTSVKALTPRTLRRGTLRQARRQVVYGKPHPPDEQLMLELRRRFKGEVVALSEHLNRDLVTLWGYDGVD